MGLCLDQYVVLHVMQSHRLLSGSTTFCSQLPYCQSPYCFCVAKENDKLKEFNVNLSTKLDQKNLVISGFEASEKIASVASDKFKKEITENEDAFNKEKIDLIKNFETQIKMLKEDLDC